MCVVTPYNSCNPSSCGGQARLEEGQPGGFAQLKNQLDVGDIVGAAGSVKRTEKGELSVVANSLQVRSVRAAMCEGVRDIACS